MEFIMSDYTKDNYLNVLINTINDENQVEFIKEIIRSNMANNFTNDKFFLFFQILDNSAPKVFQEIALMPELKEFFEDENSTHNLLYQIVMNGKLEIIDFLHNTPVINQHIHLAQENSFALSKSLGFKPIEKNTTDEAPPEFYPDCINYFTSAIEHGQLAMAKKLLSYPEVYDLLSLKPKIIDNALFICAAKGDVSSAEFLLTSDMLPVKADIHAQNEAPYRFAAYCEKHKMVDFLLTSEKLDDHAKLVFKSNKLDTGVIHNIHQLFNDDDFMVTLEQENENAAWKKLKKI